jgi:pimeloyl-ACP methyl ester carboxylesterase
MSIDLAYDDKGSGPPIVLLHGFPFNRSIWDEQVAVLTDRYRVITPDLRGFGETPLPADGASEMTDMARDVAALLDQLEIRRAVIGGLSMGGYVAFAYYRLFPLRTRGLILADTRPQADTEEGRAVRYQQAERIRAEGIGAVAQGLLDKLFSSESIQLRPELVSRIREMILNTSTEGAAGALMGMAARLDHSYLLPQILCPALIVVGSEDKIVSVSDAELMHREIRGSHLTVIEDGGHLSNLEAPEEFNTSLLDFLRTLHP